MDDRKIHVKDRGALPSLQEFIGRQLTTTSLGTVTEVGDKSNSVAFLGSGEQVSLSNNLKLVDGQYFRIADSKYTWALAISNGVTGPQILLKSPGTGAITAWDTVINLYPGAWLAPALLNGWVNVGGTWGTAGYMKDSAGFTRFKGLISTGAFGVPTFVLPVGYRPDAKSGFPIVSNGAFGWVTVQADGTVQVEAGSAVWASLEGIAFKAV